MIKVSIVVPVYNVEKYLRECVDSLISQTYRNTEIILVDDGSKDSSGAICDEYAQKYDQIQTIHKQNEGLGFARNTGMALASGDYVSFIDSDDYAAKDMIENLVKGIEANHADTCIGGFKKINDSKEILFTEQYEDSVFECAAVQNDFLLRVLGSAPGKHDCFRMSVWNAMYSMEIIRKNGLQFPSERVMISEDIVFDLMYYQYSKKVVVINNASYYYRENPNSLTTTYKPGKINKVNKLYAAVSSMIRNYYSEPVEALSRLQTTYLIKLRGCIAQEKRKRSGNNCSTVRKRIREICCNAVVQQIVSEYKNHNLEFKQKVFVLLVSKKCSLILYILGEKDVFD